MKRGLIAVLLIAMMTILAAPVWAEEAEEIEYSPSGTPVTKMKLIGSGMDMAPQSVGEWINYGASARAADGSIRIVVEGKVVEADVKPFVDSCDRTQGPVRAIGEAMGCAVDWNDTEQKVTCVKEGYVVEMIIGDETIWVNGRPQVIDTAPQIREDRTFIPVRALGEALDWHVVWSEPSLTVIVSSNGF